MRIGIDARLGAYRAGGIAEHVARLIEGLAALGPPESIVVFEHRRAAGGPPNGGRARFETHRRAAGVAPNDGRAGFETHRLFTPPHHVLEGLAVPAELARHRLDLWHAPDVVLPWAWRGPAVATVHDVAFLRRPDLLTPDSRRYYGGIHRSVRRADRVIVVSEHTRRELAALTDVDPARVRVVPNAVHPRFLAPPDAASDAAVLARHGLSGARYVLFVSTIEPRKNVGTLLEAYRRLLDGGRDLALVLAGGDGWHSAPVYDSARALDLEGRARFLGHVPGEDLPGLYRGAAALAHPALDEGFGLSALEAMAVGTPVVASNAGSLPEVVGEAGLLVPPQDVAGWSSALGRVLDEPALAAALADAGRARAAVYTVTRMARATLEVYREVEAAYRPQVRTDAA